MDRRSERITKLRRHADNRLNLGRPNTLHVYTDGAGEGFELGGKAGIGERRRGPEHGRFFAGPDERSDPVSGGNAD